MDTDEDTSLDEHMARLQEYGTYMCIYVCRVRKHTYIHACMHAYIHTYTFFAHVYHAPAIQERHVPQVEH